MSRYTTFIAVLMVIIALLSACSRGDDHAAADSAKPSEAPIIHSVITTITEKDGQLLVEVPLGRAQNITPGTLLRVLDEARDGYLKGMLQVLSVTEDELSLSRQIGLLDRRNPLQVGDPVVVISDIGELEGGHTLQQTVSKESEQSREEDEATMARFDELRTNFSNELRRLQEQHEQQLAQQQKAHKQELAEMEAAAERARKRQAAEHLTQLSAVREALADEAVKALRQDRDARKAEIERLSAANARLQQQSETLAQELQNAHQQLTQLESALERARSAHEREIRAELETREILEQRIRELEVRLGLPGAKAPAVLVGDQGREETVLARLDRISRERNELLRENDTLREQLAAATEGLGSDEDPAKQVLAARSKQLDTELERSQARLEALRQRLAGMELRHLQAERNYFNLASGVLRLPTSSPSVRQFQEQLRTDLSTMNTLSSEVIDDQASEE